MKFAVQYSKPLAQMIQSGAVTIDVFKCPSWTDLVAEASQILPVYCHMPLKIGGKNGVVIDTERKQAVDWRRIDEILELTDTPYVNVHLSPSVDDYPTMSSNTTDPADIEAITENLIAGLETVIQRYGADKVIAENCHASLGQLMYPAFLPETITNVIESTGCGFLLDVSHARLAVRQLNTTKEEYFSRLPVQHIREIHFTGIQTFDGAWYERLKSVVIDNLVLERYKGEVIDHLPLTEQDFADFEWMMDKIRDGEWQAPWVIAMEIGGIGPFWETVAEYSRFDEQMPRLYDLVREPISE